MILHTDRSVLYNPSNTKHANELLLTTTQSPEYICHLFKKAQLSI